MAARFVCGMFVADIFWMSTIQDLSHQTELSKTFEELKNRRSLFFAMTDLTGRTRAVGIGKLFRSGSQCARRGHDTDQKHDGGSEVADRVQLCNSRKVAGWRRHSQPILRLLGSVSRNLSRRAGSAVV